MAEVDSGLAGKHGGEFLTTPLGVVGAVLERIVVEEVMEVMREGIGHLRRSPGTRAIAEAVHPVMGKAIDPFPQG